MVVFDEVSFAIEENLIIKNLSFTLNDGEFLCVLGRNGSGKSTLAKLFNGIFLPQKGKISVNGLFTDDAKSLKKIRSKVGIVFQNPDNQMVTSPLEDEVAFGPENLCLSSAEIEERVEEALTAVGLIEYRKKSPEELSGGQKQLAAIAGVMAMEPEILVLDEPTSMLDPKSREDFMKILKSLKESFSLSIVLITHHMEEATLADRVMLLNEGEIAKLGTPKEAFSDVELIKKNSLTLPVITELGDILRSRGIIKAQTVLTKEELLEELK